MNKILSWKINNASYAYIFPTNGTYISNAISEDSPLWTNIIGEISTWTLDTYKSNFNKMAAEVKSKFGVTIPWKDEYWDLGIDGSVGGVNIIMLSGKGGDGDGYGSGGIGPEVYEEFNKMIDAELQKAREAIEKKNAEVKAFVEAKVTETISAAKQTIAETKAEIDETRDELEGKLEGATEALDKAAALFELGEGGIDGEAIKDVMNSVSAHTTWFNTYSGTVADFQTDYDLATKRLGEMTVASSVTDGLFSRFATSMNVVSGTVGNVETTVNAAYGEIKDVAEWINTNKDSVANVSRFMSASAALIEDKVKYIDNELTSVIERTVDGKNATIRDEIKAETASGLTNVRNEMNALSGSILQELTHYAPDSAITSMGERMDAMDTTMSTWMTKTNSAMSMTHDLREEWSIESGKISTVTNLVAKTDANGEVEYWVSGETGNLIRVRRYETNPKYWMGEDGNLYEDYRVFVEYSDTLGSYIQQEVSSITMSVMGADNMTAAIRLAVEEDEKNGGEAIISLVANKVVIDATVIASAISAKTANIGGIMMGNGIVEAMATFPVEEEYYISSSATIDETSEPLILEVELVSGTVLNNPIYAVKLSNTLDKKYIDEPNRDLHIQILYSRYKHPLIIDGEFVLFDIPCTTRNYDSEEPIWKPGTIWFINTNTERLAPLPTLEYDKTPFVVRADCVYSHIEESDLVITTKYYFSAVTAKINEFEVVLNDNEEWVDEYDNIYDETTLQTRKKTVYKPAFTLDGRDGTITAFNAKIYGEVFATKGHFGSLDISASGVTNDNFTLDNEGLIMKGSIRQPFIEYPTDIFTKKDDVSDNFLITVSGKTLPSLLCESNNIGRRITLLHNFNNNITEKTTVSMTLPSGYTFIEEGVSVNTLYLNGSSVELLGIGSNNQFQSWVVMSRTTFHRNDAKGLNFKAVCMGRISGSILKHIASIDGSAVKPHSEANWNAMAEYNFISLSAATSNPKEWKLRLPTKWFGNLSRDVISIQVTPQGTLCNCACINNINNQVFTIACSESNADLDFVVYNTSMWDTSLKTQYNYFIPSQTNLIFYGNEYGHSYIKTISFIEMNVKDWSYNLRAISGDVSDFKVTVNKDSMYITVYPTSQITSKVTGTGTTIQYALKENIMNITVNATFNDNTSTSNVITLRQTTILSNLLETGKR